MNNFFTKKGFTLIEVMVVVVIIGILVYFTLNPFGNWRDKKIVPTMAEAVVSLLNEARAKTLAGTADMAYGVHFDTTQATLFAGSYVAGAAGNEVFTLDPLTTIVSTALAGGGNDIIFQRLTGATNQAGTVVIGSVASSTLRQTITVSSLGLIETN